MPPSDPRSLYSLAVFNIRPERLRGPRVWSGPTPTHFGAGEWGQAYARLRAMISATRAFRSIIQTPYPIPTYRPYGPAARWYFKRGFRPVDTGHA